LHFKEELRMGRGKLVFKGQEKAKKKRKKSKHDDVGSNDALILSSTDGAAERLVEDDNKPPPLLKPAPAASTQNTSSPKIQKGKGLISTSGTVVTGHDTKFTRQVNVGDAILVNQEMRVVTMRLSDTSLNLSSSFTQNVPTPIEFSYINKPRDRVKDSKVAERKAAIDRNEEEEHAFGTYASTSKEMVFRERTEHGSYRIKKVKLADSDASRGGLLEMRAKKTSDKYC
jgi:hypothetical protein